MNERKSEDLVGPSTSPVSTNHVATEERKVRRWVRLLVLAILPLLVLLPTDIDTLAAPGGTVPPIPRRISKWAVENNIYIEDLGDSPIPDDVETVYLIKDVFTTINGSWEVSDDRWSIPQWARDDYLTAEFHNAGADHHLFAAVLGEDGGLIKLKEIIYWSGGFDKVNDPTYDDYRHRETEERAGWGNLDIYSNYYPDQGQSGPWCWMPTGGSETLCGGGLPYNNHVSTFAVWQAVPANVPPVLSASPNALSETVEQGQIGGPFSIELTNAASDADIPFSYTVRGDPDWITVVASSGHTPATLEVTLDAIKLLVGNYRTSIEIEAESEDMVEPNLSIPISLTVAAPTLGAEPDVAHFAYPSCEGDLTSRSLQIQVSGPAGATVAASIVASMSSTEPVPWATVDPTTFEVPSIITVTVDPNLRSADLEQAVLVLAEQGGGGLKQTDPIYVPIYVSCASIFLPIVVN